MLALAYAFAPAAAVSLFAASLPVLSGLRQRQVRVAQPARAASGEALEITAAADDAVLSIGLRNRSGGVGTLALSVSLYDAAGAECARYELPALRLLPGRSLDEQLELRALGAGRYRAIVVAEFGGELFAADYAWTHTVRAAALAPETMAAAA
jgi:hypothetical protein